jgi:iron(III) transport system ATP-binding protein
MSRVVIELVTVTRAYARDGVAVQDLSLTVEAGEVLALLGPSGSGKSTVLRLIAGLEAPDAGLIRLEGRTAAGGGRWVPPERRRVGLVFQDGALFPHLTVAENVAFGLRERPAAWRHHQVARFLRLVGLEGLGDRRPHQLSGGQQQRVALARALAPEPATVLLDEPFSNLDADRRAAMRLQVRDLLAQLGATAVFVTHDQEEALVMGDRLAILRAGRLEQVGPPEDVYAAPANRFVARFLGNAYFLPAVVTPTGLDTPLGPVDQRPQLAAGMGVELLVRPDDLRLVADAAGTARIATVAFQGMHYRYDVTLADGTAVGCLAAHTARLEVGSPVRVELAAGHALAWFPAEQWPDG